MSYKFQTTLQLPFDDAVERVRQALDVFEFGVITEIDVKAVMKKKLDLEFKNYLILGACNPQFAHKALSQMDDIGLLLPCNVIVYETNDNQVIVSTMKPTHLLGLVGSEEVTQVAQIVEKKLEDFILSL